MLKILFAPYQTQRRKKSKQINKKSDLTPSEMAQMFVANAFDMHFYGTQLILSILEYSC